MDAPGGYWEVGGPATGGIFLCRRRAFRFGVLTAQRAAMRGTAPLRPRMALSLQQRVSYALGLAVGRLA